ncbi:hypothetical protein [Streptomyces sp. NPDC051554]|uniref:hypothetical protein n=1 Tax=Streptomyces sp. NPDC051554 TaxID=3365656 RepID=UPI00379681BD
MTGRQRLRRLVVSLVVWWMLIALILWLLGTMLGQPASLAQCTASSAFFVAVGEVGDWLLRRRRRRAGRPSGIAARHQPPDVKAPTTDP